MWVVPRKKMFFVPVAVKGIRDYFLEEQLWKEFLFRTER